MFAPLVCAAAISAAPQTAPTAKPFFTSPFLVGAHRGGVEEVPENTALAFATTARKYPGILLETDARLTSDGQVVLLHDETVDRTTNGKGDVRSKSLAEVRSLDAGFRFTKDGRSFPFRGKRIRIATLEEALDAAPGSRFEVDLKSTDVVRAVVDVVVRKRAQDRVLFASFLPEAMTQLRTLLPNAATCYDFLNGARLLSALRGNKWDAYAPEADVVSIMKEQVAQYRLTDEEISRIRAKGIRFQIHTLDTPDEIRMWNRKGVDSILTDRPAVLAAEALGRPMVRTHAHNDYEHPRPLFDALEYGFASIEADIFLMDGELRVGHNRSDLRPGRTLESLYLEPLFARFRALGSVYPWRGEVSLLVDIKEGGDAIYRELSRRLERYQAMLTSMEGNGRVIHRAVLIVLSGDRPVGALLTAKSRRMFLDGRPQDPAAEPSLAPLVSDSYLSLLRWNGRGEMPADQKTKLREFVATFHARGQRVRLWGMPDTPDCWREMMDAGIDYVNTDRLAELSEFMRSR